MSEAIVLSKVTEFSASNSVYLLTTDHLLSLNPSDVTKELIGEKAYGLACLPSEWVPPFCVISHSVAEKVASDLNSKILNQLSEVSWISRFASSDFMIRSSAVNESISERGKLISEQTSFNTLRQTLSKCVHDTKSHNQIIHWILQPKINIKNIGHLSNERRLSLVKRDWVVDFEPTQNQTETREPISFGIRSWRDGTSKPSALIECSSSIGIDRALREPAQWATEKKLRLHYEWVWDGTNVWIVQADLCTDLAGKKPSDFIPKSISKIQAANLKCFRFSVPSDFELYRKLGNTKLYSQLGYEPPQFYILDNRNFIAELINGNPSEMVLSDIAALVAQQPLVIRCDGIQKQMLPRSDGLTSVRAVTEWFNKTLPSELTSVGNWQESLIFICHHFLPALASAWSMSEPNKRVVRVEALWGIPEGMYWYSHDAFEIDTSEVDLPKAISNRSKFKYSERLRFKEWYVAADGDGIWNTQHTSAPYDWKPTITNTEWLSEMAIVTRQIADKLGYPVNVMWFLGVHKDASKHAILPWFHEQSALDRGSLRVAPRFKNPNSRAIEIRTLKDWDELLGSETSNKNSIKRISVSPREPNLIRNDPFVESLAEFAKAQDAVIELKGGILSHVFYILQRKGCIVEIVDPFGTTEESLVFKKVVRDKIPESIEQKGESVTHLKIRGDQLVNALKSKLLEEALEVMDAKSTADTIEELADVLEVIHALTHHLKVSMNSVEETRKKKRDERGGFNEGIVLVKTSTPTSLSLEKLSDVQIQSLFDEGVVIEAGAISLEHDIKLHQDEPELFGVKQRLLEIEFPATPDRRIVKNTEFKIVTKLENGVVEIPLSGEWSITRKKSELKVRFLITPAPVQGELPFES